MDTYNQKTSIDLSKAAAEVGLSAEGFIEMISAAIASGKPIPQADVLAQIRRDLTKVRRDAGR